MVQATEATLVPEEGIVDYKEVMKKLVILIEEDGGKVHFNCPVWSLIQTQSGEITIKSAIKTIPTNV